MPINRHRVKAVLHLCFSPLQKRLFTAPHKVVSSTFKSTDIGKSLTVLNLYKKSPVKLKMAFQSRILILLATLLYEQYMHYTQANIRPNLQYLSTQQYAYQSFYS